MVHTTWFKNHFFEVLPQINDNSNLEKYITIPNYGRYEYSSMYWYNEQIHITLSSSNKIKIKEVSISEFTVLVNSLR